MQISPTPVHPSVALAQSDSFAASLRAVVGSVMPSCKSLPSEAQVIFHCIAGGTIHSSEVSRSVHASLLYNFGPGSNFEDSSTNEIHLCSRQANLGLFKESLARFVERAHALAINELDNVRFLRNYEPHSRAKVATKHFTDYLQAKEINLSGSGSLLVWFPEHEPKSRWGVGLFADNGDVAIISEILNNRFGARIAEMLKSPRELVPDRPLSAYRENPGPAKERGQLLWFDNMPIAVLPFRGGEEYMHPNLDRSILCPKEYLTGVLLNAKNDVYVG